MKFLRIVALAVAAWLGCPAACSAQAQRPAKTGCQAHLERWQQLAEANVSEWRVRPAGEFRGEAADLDDSGWERVESRWGWNAAKTWEAAKSVALPERCA